MSWPKAWAKMGNTTHYAPVDFRKDLETSSTFWAIESKNWTIPREKRKTRSYALERVEQKPEEAEGVEFLGRNIEGRGYPSGSYSETSGYAYFNGDLDSDHRWYKDANWDSSSKKVEWYKIVDLNARNEQQQIAEHHTVAAYNYYRQREEDDSNCMQQAKDNGANSLK